MPQKRKPQTRIVQKPRQAPPPKPAAPRWFVTETIADRLRLARAMSEYAGDMVTIPSLMKISYPTLSGWERGQNAARRFPRETLERLAELYGCDAEWLITGTPSPEAVELANDEKMAWERALSPVWADTLENTLRPGQDGQPPGGGKRRHSGLPAALLVA